MSKSELIKAPNQELLLNAIVEWYAEYYKEAYCDIFIRVIEFSPFKEDCVTANVYYEE